MQEIDLTYWDCKDEWEGWTGAHFDRMQSVTIYIKGEERLTSFILWLFTSLEESERSRKRKGSLVGIWGAEMQAASDEDTTLITWHLWPDLFISVPGGLPIFKKWLAYLVPMAIKNARKPALPGVKSQDFAMRDAMMQLIATMPDEVINSLGAATQDKDQGAFLDRLYAYLSEHDQATLQRMMEITGRK
jgi:hypothetical protein